MEIIIDYEWLSSLFQMELYIFAHQSWFSIINVWFLTLPGRKLNTGTVKNKSIM